MTFNLVRRGALGLFCLVLGACVNTPRNGTKLTMRGGSLSVSGVISKPNAFVAVLMRKQAVGTQSAKWVDIAQGVQSSTTAVKDAVGATFYSYSGTVSLPGSAEYWKSASSVSGQRRVMTSIALQNSNDGYLASFDDNSATDTCTDQFKPQGLLQVIDHCASGNSPAIDLYSSCGKSGQECCIASNIKTSALCDAGHLCDSAGRCTIASGGLGQPCNGDGSCASGGTCIANTCRDATVEKLPLMTLDLRVTTCDDSSWNIGSSGSTTDVDLGTGPFYIEVPGTELRNNTVDTFGISPSDIGTLGDITKLDIHIYNRDWCVKKVELLANNIVAFSKSYSSPLYLKATYPSHNATLSIARDELRTFWTTHSSTTLCQGPAQIPGSAITRKITGALGNVLATSDDVIGDFDEGGYVHVTRSSASTMKVDTRFMATKFVNGIGDVDLNVDANFSLTFSCNPATNSISVAMSPIDVDDVDGNALYDIVNLFSIGVVDVYTEAITALALNSDSASLAASLSSVISDLPACPALTVDTASPPNLAIGYPAGLQPSQVPICQ